MLLGDIIKDYREKYSLSLQDFADLVHTSRSYIHMLEKNYNPSTGKPINPNIGTLRTIAYAMSMSIEELLQKLDSDKYEYENKTLLKDNLNSELINCGKRLKESREKKNFSFKYVEEKTGYKIKTLQRWEDGYTYDISTQAFNILADLYNVDVLWLRGLDITLEQSIALKIPLNDLLDYPNNGKILKLLNNFEKLNNLGKDKAIENVTDLTEVPKYIEKETELQEDE